MGSGAEMAKDGMVAGERERARGRRREGMKERLSYIKLRLFLLVGD